MSYTTDFQLAPKALYKFSANRFFVYVRGCGVYICPGQHGDIPTSLNDQYNDNLMVLFGQASNPTWSITEYYRHHAFHIRFIGYPSIEEKADLMLLIKLKSPDPNVDNSRVEIYQGATRINTPEGETSWLIRNGVETIPITVTCPNDGTYIDIIIRPITTPSVALQKIWGFILP